MYIHHIPQTLLHLTLKIFCVLDPNCRFSFFWCQLDLSEVDSPPMLCRYTSIQLKPSYTVGFFSGRNSLPHNSQITGILLMALKVQQC